MLLEMRDEVSIISRRAVIRAVFTMWEELVDAWRRLRKSSLGLTDDFSSCLSHIQILDTLNHCSNALL